MKLVRYDRNGAIRVGAIEGDEIIDLLDAAPTGTDTKLLAAMSDTSSARGCSLRKALPSPW